MAHASLAAIYKLFKVFSVLGAGPEIRAGGAVVFTPGE